MGYLNADQIAEKFSGSHECSSWLTQKQAGWLFGQFHREHPEAQQYGSSQGQIKGEFSCQGNSYLWTANLAPNKAALFKVAKSQPTKPIVYSFQDFVASKGHDWNKILNTPLMGQLTIEFSQVNIGA